MRNIALAGGMGAGKTTVADVLIEQHGYAAVKISRPIYEIAEKLWGPEAAKDRAKLQDLGEKMREIDPDVWINYYVRTIAEPRPGLPSGHGGWLYDERPIVNDTLRFPNEYWALKAADFVMVRVNAPEEVRVDRLQKIGRIQDLDRLHHISETALFGAQAESEGIHFDYEIWNDTDTEHMELEVRNLIHKLEGEE